MSVAKFAVLGAMFVSLGSLPAFAADGALRDGGSMYAGPDASYPEVMHLARGLSVAIHGCLEGRQWCDVTWRGNRGWVQGAMLEYRHAPVVGDSGVPTVAFDLGGYWDSNYKNRLWYMERAKWQSLTPASAQTASASGNQ